MWNYIDWSVCLLWWWIEPFQDHGRWFLSLLSSSHFIILFFNISAVSNIRLFPTLDTVEILYIHYTVYNCIGRIFLHTLLYHENVNLLCNISGPYNRAILTLHTACNTSLIYINTLYCCAYQTTRHPVAPGTHEVKSMWHMWPSAGQHLYAIGSNSSSYLKEHLWRTEQYIQWHRGFVT